MPAASWVIGASVRPRLAELEVAHTRSNHSVTGFCVTKCQVDPGSLEGPVRNLNVVLTLGFCASFSKCLERESANLGTRLSSWNGHRLHDRSKPLSTTQILIKDVGLKLSNPNCSHQVVPHCA